ncbi:MAG: hypothetical protein U0521_13095 [Anaerolineae bacterium]
MRLTIDGVPRPFMPIRVFREAHGLPPTFGVALFEPKDYTGLGRIDQAGGGIERRARGGARRHPRAVGRFTAIRLRARTLPASSRINSTPSIPKSTCTTWKSSSPPPGSPDVCQAVLYAIMRAHGAAPPPFEAIYGEWLDQTARVPQRFSAYAHWQVQIVTHALRARRVDRARRSRDVLRRIWR